MYFKLYIYLINMYKEDLALKNVQWLICYKTQPRKAKKVIVIMGRLGPVNISNLENSAYIRKALYLFFLLFFFFLILLVLHFFFLNLVWTSISDQC